MRIRHGGRFRGRARAEGTSPQIPAGHAFRIGGDLVRRARGDDAPAGGTSAGTHVDDPVGIGDHVEIVLDDDDGRPAFDEPVEHTEQHAHVQRVQADGRLVEHEHGIRLGASHLAGELEPLRLPAGQGGRRLTQREIAESQIV